MNQLFYGSICVTDLIEQLKKQHSAFLKAQNKKVYANVRVWLNDEEDRYGNVMSIQLSSKKELQEKEGKIYLGNCKKSEPIQTAPTNTDVDSLTEPLDDLPF